jgi:hypothetical protein
MNRMTPLVYLLAAHLLLFPALSYGEDTKQIGARYRIKVTSAGVPTLGGVVSGYKMRTKYKVYSGDKFIGWAYLGDYVYVQEPGKYRIQVNGINHTESFEIPKEMTRDRIAASWKRSRAVELRPKSLGQRLAIPSIWVLHPPHVTGVHNDDFTIEPLDGQRVVAKGVALVYPPEEIKDIDDGVLFSNTLIHLMPGDYQLRINGTLYFFQLKKGESKLIRLGAFSVTKKDLGNVSLRQLLANAKKNPIADPKDKNWFVAAPGKYLFGEQAVILGEGRALQLRLKKRITPGLRRPRLLVRAITDKGVRINGILTGSPVAAAGLKVGDRIVAFDEAPITSTKDLARLLLKKDMGDMAILTVERPGRSGSFKVTLKLGQKAKIKRKIY